MVAELPGLREWTLDEVERMIGAGVIENPENFEFYDGHIWEKMGQMPPHSWGVHLALRALAEVFGLNAVGVQTTLRLGPKDAPEPDLIVMTPYDPRGTMADVQLVVEISDTTIAKDLGRKANLYARYEANEYWVVDVISRVLYVHRTAKNGAWADVRRLAESESIAPLAAPETAIRITDLLPPTE